ncbi:FUSC family protein, partial [Acinetobacter baumannii]
MGFLIYAAKCVSGVLIVSTLSWLLNYTEFAWCLISVILVLSPDGKDSVSLAFNRIKANLVGAGVGLLCLLFFTSNMWSISLAVSTALAI